MPDENQRGRPSVYTPEIADEICRRLAEGESLRQICKDKHMVGLTTVFKWINTMDDFAKQYARAREEQAEKYADEIILIADTAEDAALARLQIDARKWVASKLKPKTYGDKLTHEGNPEKPISHSLTVSYIDADSNPQSVPVPSGT